MPELPEVEVLRLGLESRLRSARVHAVRILRPDVITGGRKPSDLLSGDSITTFLRRGKQLAITSSSGRAVCIHLGMSGQLLLAPAPRRRPTTPIADHTHVIWHLAAPDGSRFELRFRDPRRFGGIWTFPSAAELKSRWESLGPDALSIRADQLRTALRASRAPIKARLLDQSVLAGVGNIYADEALFLAGIRPGRSSLSLTDSEITDLARHIRAVLRKAIRAGGSSMRDYLHPDGTSGDYQAQRLAYGREHQPCANCRRPLIRTLIAQRSSVWCTSCQV